MTGPFLSPRFVILDAMRFVFALVVVMFHTFAPVTPAPARGYLAVDFFFVLSGFVLCVAYAQRISEQHGLWNFSVDRVARLLPLHLATLLFMIAAELVLAAVDGRHIVGPSNLSPHVILANLTLTQGIGAVDNLSWNVPAWSTSVEMYANALLALALIWSLQSRAKGRCLYLGLGIACAAYLVLFLGAPTLEREDLGVTSFSPGLLRGLGGIAAGMVCYSAYTRLRDRSLPWGPMAIASLLTLFALLISRQGAVHDLVAVPLICAFVVSAAAQETARPWDGWPATTMIALGALSYGVYLLHWPIYKLTALGFAQPGMGRAVLIVGVSVLVSIPVYYLFELPAKIRIKRWLYRSGVDIHQNEEGHGKSGGEVDAIDRHVAATATHRHGAVGVEAPVIGRAGIIG